MAVRARRRRAAGVYLVFRHMGFDAPAAGNLAAVALTAERGPDPGFALGPSRDGWTVDAIERLTTIRRLVRANLLQP